MYESEEEKPFLKIGLLELVKVSLTENHLQSLLIFWHYYWFLSAN